MDLDLKHYRIIEAREDTIVAFRPTPDQIEQGVIPLMVLKDVKTPEAESILAHAKPEQFPLAIRPETKVGLFTYKRRPDGEISPQNDMSPFTLFYGQAQQMSAQEQSAAIDAINASTSFIHQATRSMIAGNVPPQR